MNPSVIKPNWPAPACVKAFTTMRLGGVSLPPYHQMNLAAHVGDQAESVNINRALLKKQLNLPADPTWIQQTHSTIVLPASPDNTEKEADATLTDQSERICVVLTADCLPILVCHRKGTHVAAIHVGWRGLLGGIIENTLTALNLPPQELLIWLGPAISAQHYEVGEEVRNAFLVTDPDTHQAFSPSPQKRWLADLYTLARLRLRKMGATAIYGGEYCTYSNKECFFSYRRDGEKTGRMASLIYFHKRVR